MATGRDTQKERRTQIWRYRQTYRLTDGHTHTRAHTHTHTHTERERERESE